MDKKHYIYKHTAPNGKIYIGQTCQTLKKRFGNNGYRYKGSTLFYNAIQKYGWDNFKHEILFEGLSQEEANLKEIELIQKFRSNERDFGYNLQSGGLNGSPSEETRKKISERQIGKVLSEETKQKISIAKIGRKDSEETRKKKSNGHKGKHLSEETKQKLSKLGKERTDDKLRQHARELGYSNRGRKHSEEARKHMSESRNPINRKKVLCVETGVIYNSITEAATQTKLYRQNIGKACNGELKTTGGYHWELVCI